MKEFDSETLSQFNGKDGQPVYIAHKGRVFDVSKSKLWKTGLHMKRHPAGQELTSDIEAAPHGPDVLERYPQVGILKIKGVADETLPRPLEVLLGRLPFLYRHPHPMLVHFPIAFMVSPVIFFLLYLITAAGSLEATAFQCLGAGILFSVPGMMTGFFTWWLNYQAKPLRPVRIKILFSILLLAVSLLAFLLRLFLPAAVISFAWAGILYLLLLFALVPIVSVIGWHGASLTFPLERK